MIREQTITTPATTSDNHSTAAIARSLVPALMIGGATWIAYYGIWIAIGIATGASPVPGTLSSLLTSVIFNLALVGIHSGLAGIGLQVRQRSKGFGHAGLAFALLGALFTIAGLIGYAFGADRPGALGGLSVVSSCLSATLLGIAVLRSRVMPRAHGLLLLAIGVITFPLIVLITSILPNLPAWIVDEFPFAVAGSAWIIFGSQAKRRLV